MADYPGTIVNLPRIPDTDPDTGTRLDEVNHGDLHNDIADEIEAVQAELGSNPAGSDGTVVDRLDRMELPDGSHDGDLLAWDGSAWETRGPRRFEGHGQPSSSLGSVGDRYVDLDETAGALEWIKTGGGWVVTYGDTGWREIIFTPDPDTYSGLEKLWIIRHNNTVDIRIRANSSHDHPQSYETTTIPSGFRPPKPAGFGGANYTVGSVYNAGLNDRGARSSESALVIGSSSNMLYLYCGLSTRLGGNITYQCGDPWPTTLPGTAA